MANEKLGPLVAGLSSSDLEQIASNAWRLEVQPGEQVVQQGSIKADNFYVVASGHLEVIKDGDRSSQTIGIYAQVFKPSMMENSY